MARSLRILLLSSVLSAVLGAWPPTSTFTFAAELDKKGKSDAREAMRFYKEGNYEDAAKLFLRLSINYPDMLVFVRNLGACYYYMRRYEPALSNLRDYLHRKTDIPADDRAEVAGWIGEMERLRDQAAAAAVPPPVPPATTTPPAAAPVPPVPVPVPSVPTPAPQAGSDATPAPAAPATPPAVAGAVSGPTPGPATSAPPAAPGAPAAASAPSAAAPAAETAAAAGPEATFPSQYPPQGPYPGQPSFPAQPGYPSQPAYPPSAAYPEQGGYQAQPAYPPSASYPAAASPGYAPQAGVTTQAPPAPQSGGTGRKVAAWLIGIAGIGTAGAGGYFTYKAHTKAKDLEKQYDPSVEDSRKKAVLASGVCYGIGGALVLTAIIVGATSGSSGGVAVAPAVGPGLAGATLSGSF